MPPLLMVEVGKDLEMYLSLTVAFNIAVTILKTYVTKKCDNATAWTDLNEWSPPFLT